MEARQQRLIDQATETRVAAYGALKDASGMRRRSGKLVRMHDIMPMDPKVATPLAFVLSFVGEAATIYAAGTIEGISHTRTPCGNRVVRGHAALGGEGDETSSRTSTQPGESRVGWAGHKRTVKIQIFD